MLHGLLATLWTDCSILGTYWPGEFIFQCPIFLPFHILHGILKERILKWFAIPFSSGPHSVRSLHHDPPIFWVAPRAWLSFTELDKAVVLVWLDWLVFCEYGFSVSALWCPLATPTILLGFLLPWAWGISLCSCKVQPLLLTLDEGYLLTAALPDFQRGIAPLGPLHL